MAFKDYENLDVTRETASKKELEKLKDKYKVDKGYVVDIREMSLCLGIALILTVAIILLYGNVIKLSIDFILSMFIAYFGMLSTVVLSISRIIQRINTKWYVCVALLGIDASICMTSLIIANMVLISSTLQTIVAIIGMTTITLFFALIYMVVKFEPKK